MSQSDANSKPVEHGLRLSSPTKNYILMLTLGVMCAIIYSALLQKRSTNVSLDCTFSRAVKETIKLFTELKSVLEV